MKIKEVIYRDCCQSEDLLPSYGASFKRFGVPTKTYCKHCGKRFEIITYTDAAGSTDWDYREIKNTTKS